MRRPSLIRSVLSSTGFLALLLSLVFSFSSAVLSPLPSERGEENASVNSELPVPVPGVFSPRPLTVISGDSPTALLLQPEEEPSERPSSDPSDFLWPEGAAEVLTADLSGGQTPDRLLSVNETAACPDITALADRSFHIDVGTEASAGGDPSSSLPLVLIVHTHGTESYLPEDRVGKPAYTLTEDTFTDEDIGNNVVAVGRVLAETLWENGIPTVHCEIMHNLTSYENAYPLECETVLSYLAQYPSIRYVLDLHRDCMMTEGGKYLRTVFPTEDGDAAQIMFVVGTNENGADHPDWENNLTVAAKWQRKLIGRYPSAARPINLRKSSFNEQYTPGSLLIEVGTNVNTLAEAKRSAVLLGETLAELIGELA